MDIRAFFEQQLSTWPALVEGTERLKAAARRTVCVYGDDLTLQHNPQRIKSTIATVSAAALAQRPCFLCKENRPPEQQELELAPGFLLLCNPYPIFPMHFTVAGDHVPQSIIGQGLKSFELARLLGPDFVLFFNGARAGASAPDHLHYQACPVEQFPLTNKRPEAYLLSYAGLCYVYFSSDDSHALSTVLEQLAEILDTLSDHGSDLLNLLIHWNGTQWKTIVIPREQHRPACFYASGNAQVLMSPATVELGGTIVTPREEDFEKLDAEQIHQIFKEVCLSSQKFSVIKEFLATLA